MDWLSLAPAGSRKCERSNSVDCVAVAIIDLLIITKPAYIYLLIVAKPGYIY